MFARHWIHFTFDRIIRRRRWSWRLPAVTLLSLTLRMLGPISAQAQDAVPLTIYPIWRADSGDHATTIAWGDVDGDGDLDLAVGDYKLNSTDGQPNRLYLNEGGILQTNAVWRSDDSDKTTIVAWGDVDGDGDLDLAIGNKGIHDGITFLGHPNKIYLNQDGMLQTTAAWSSADSDITNSIAWGDVDGDGDLDLAVGNGVYDNTCSCIAGGPNRIYLNEGGALQTTAAWSSDESDITNSIAWGDVDGDGDLDLAVGNRGQQIGYVGQQNRVYLNNRQGGRTLPNSGLAIRIASPSADSANFYAQSHILTSQAISFTYTLVDPEGDPVSRIEVEYSTNGGGKWLPAVATSATITSHLTTSALGDTHLFTWDTLQGEGLFGQFDNLRSRIRAYPQSAQASNPGDYQYRNSAPGPFQRPYASATTFPFRVRGTQVQVITSTTALTSVADALVYHLPAGHISVDPNQFGTIFSE